MPTRPALLISLLFLAALRSFAQPPSATQSSIRANASPQSAADPIPTLHVTARLVVLDVVVTDAHGNPVPGLKPSDFILTEDGVPQTLANLDERNATAAPIPSQTSLPLNTFTDHPPVTNSVAMTTILFDTSELPAPDAAYARDQVAAYVKTVVPGTPICIFNLDSNGLQLIQDFTTDPQVLRQAVQSKRNEQKPNRSPHFSPMLRRNIAMRQLARYLSGFPGRKNLIWFYGTTPRQLRIGGPGGLFPDIDTFNSLSGQINGISDTLTLNRIALYPVDPRGVVYDQDPNSMRSPEPGFAGKVAQISLNTVAFPQDHAAVVLQQGADSDALAKATGGKAFYNSNHIKQDVAEVVATGSHYYTMSYAPTNPNWDGNFRTIKIALAAGSSTGATGIESPAHSRAPLRFGYPTGYYALDTQPTHSPRIPARSLISYSPGSDPNQTPLGDAMSFGTVPPFQILFKARVAPASDTEKIKHSEMPRDGNYLGPQWRHSPYRDYQIHYSIDPQDLQFEHRTSGSFHDTVQLVAVVYDEHGVIVNSLTDTVPVDVNAQNVALIKEAGLGMSLKIAIPSHGDFYLRLGVHDLNTGRIGVLEIPTGSIKPQPSLGAP